MDGIYVDQMLFGYNNGHTLINTSLDKTLWRQKDVDFLSDASGMGSFKSYITCYPIYEDGYYVFAKTWYAEELERPGCVWTHIVLVSFNDLTSMKEGIDIEAIFQRPDINEGFGQYGKKILCPAKKKQVINYSKYAIYTLLRSDRKIIIEDENTEKYEKPLLSILPILPIYILQKLTICTCSLANRYIDGIVFDYQITIPGKINILSREIENVVVYKNIEARFNYPLWVKYLDDKFTNNEYEKLFKLVGKRSGKLFLKDINMKENKYLNASSFANMMQRLCKSEKYLKIIDDSRKKIIIDKNKDIVGGASLLDTLIVEPKNKFMSMINSFLNDKKLAIKDMAILRELLNNIMYTDISKDYNKFKALSNEIFRIIKRNSFNDELLEDTKVELRGEIKSYEDFLGHLRNKNKVVENKELKLGDRKERINEYKKNKLKQKIKIKKSSLSSESKLWIDILVDQLLAFDKDMIDNFKTDYKSYLPVENNDINEIIDVVIKQLEYKDADEDIIDTLKGVNL
mgnify:CR=1 FL=1